MTARRASCGAGRCSFTTRRRVLRILLLGSLVGLAMMATGCQSVLKDILSGDECGDHAVCERHAAAAGAGAAVAGAAAAYVQKKQDNPSEPWPWETDADKAEMDAELEELAKGKGLRLKQQVSEQPSEPVEEQEETETKSKKKEPEQLTEPFEEQHGTEPENQEPEQSTEPVEEQEETTPDSEETTDEGKEEEKEQETPSVEVEKPDRGKDKDKKKVKAPAEKYVPVTSVGNVTVLVDPDTGKVAIGGGRFIGGKDENGYWLTQDGKVVLYNERTRNATVTDGVFTLEKEGKSYTLTSGNKLLASDGKGGFEVSDGHFTVARDGSAFGITKDNKVVAYDRASGNFVVSDGRFTAEHADKSYTLTKDNKVITFDRASGNFKISDGHYVLQRENSVTVFTKDKVQLTYNESAGTGSVKVWGQKGELKVGAGREGSWLVDGKVKGSIDGTPTTFKVSAEQYRLPDAGQRGFRGGVDIQQKDCGLTLTYGKDDVSRTFSADVRNRDWTVGFSRAGDNETYRAGWRNVFVSYGRESGGSATMAGYTRKF